MSHRRLPFINILTTTTAITRWPGFLGIIICICRGTPIVTIRTHLRFHIKMIQQHKFLAYFMLIWRNVSTKQQKTRIAIATFHISQYLIVCTIFFDDVKHMFDR